MQFSLQDMIQQTMDEADGRIKTAAAEDMSDEEQSKDKKKAGPPAETPPDDSSTKPERNDQAEEEKTASSSLVEQLASAVEYCNENLLKVAAAPEKTTVGAGIGETAMPTDMDNRPGGDGKQSYVTGEAGFGKIPMSSGSDKPSEGVIQPENAMETDKTSRPGGEEDWSAKEPMAEKTPLKDQGTPMADDPKTMKVARVLGILTKMAADAESPASNQASHSDVRPCASKSEEGVPSQPAKMSKGEGMVSSIERVINLTKGEAKAEPKAQMSQVLTEPAQKKATDPVLHENLDATSKAGVKIAAARTLLEGILKRAESEDATPEEKEKAEKLKAAFKAKEQEKTSQGDADMPVGGGY